MANELRPAEVIRRKRAALEMLLRNWAGRLEAQAKTEATWNDKTGQARQGIHAGVEIQGSRIILYLAHSVSYGRYLELGTGLYGPYRRTYDIRPKNAKALFWPGAAHPVKAVLNHPGMKPRPIIVPTFEKNKNAIRRDVRRLLNA